LVIILRSFVNRAPGIQSTGNKLQAQTQQMKNYVSSWQQSSQPLPVTGQSRVCTRHNTTVRSTQWRNKWLHATCL